MTTTVVCWNIAKKHKAWRELVEMGADVALLQEAGMPPADVAGRVDTGPREHWDSHVWNSDWWEGRGWRSLFERSAMVVKLADRVEVEWFKQVAPISEVAADEIAVSGIGTIAAARVTPRDGSEPFIAVSMYAKWVKPHPTVETPWWAGYPDASAHRIISDLSAFIGNTDPTTHRILAAGDLNIIYGALGRDPQWLTARDQSVFDRMDALDLEFLGPRYPNGRQADPRPSDLPPDTANVPTYYGSRQCIETASTQLDYAFASRGFHESVTVRAMNSVEEWGASDHCRLRIHVSG